MKQFNLQTGKIGEEIAKEFLKKKGYKILEQNYKTKYGEIDLVAETRLRQGFGGRRKELVIVEVRTKIGDLYGTPEESLTKKKLRKIWLNALSYVGRKERERRIKGGVKGNWARGWDGKYRVDAVCIVLRPDLSVERLNHYEYITP